MALASQMAMTAPAGAENSFSKVNLAPDKDVMSADGYKQEDGTIT